MRDLEFGEGCPGSGKTHSLEQKADIGAISRAASISDVSGSQCI
jgi:hypothetical protein